MYSVLIVDDNPMIRDGIRQHVDWDGLAVSKISEAQDGIAALELIGEGFPDIIITDIKMPGMDGLALSGRVHEQFPHIKTVILTGYADFSFAQKAIQYGVFDFILKPTKPKEIFDCLQKAIKSFEGKTPAKKVDNRLIESAIAYINAHYSENIRLVQISEELHVNGSYLSRLFKKVTGETITEVITKVKLEKAQELLTTTDMRFYEVAHTVGIEDGAYFSLLFKKYTGLTPREYKQSKS